MSRIILPRLYPITDIQISGLSHVEQLSYLSDGGATFVQIREKYLSPLEFCDQARTAVELARERKVKTIINDRADIAVAVGADGVHLGQDDLPPEAARRLMGDEAIIGYSTHNIDQARRAADLPINYIAIGPIFATSSKMNPDPVVGLDGLCRVRDSTTGIPLVAIGGIGLANAVDVIRAGADCVAVVSSLLSKRDEITSRTAAFLDLLSDA